MALGLASGMLMTQATGCDAIGDIAEQCGLACPAEGEGIIAGNASISGIVEVDAFFGAVVDLSAAASNVQATFRAELDAMALSVGLEPGAAAADISAAVKGRFDAALDGGIQIKFKPAECKASVEVAAKAAAECDVEVDPGSVEVKCEGSCQADVMAEASCDANAEVKCVGTAPNLECMGECSGECNLEVAAECSGTCRGTCNGECSVTDSMGNCAGGCAGECQGTCELNAGGSCEGKCEGSCEYTPPDAQCEANAEVRCEAMAGASIECDGQCEGSVEPPEVSAECEATVEAKAEASVECTPPELDVTYQWSAEFEGDLEAQAQFKAWLTGFKGQYSAMIAATAKIEGHLLPALELVVGAGADAVGSVVGELSGSGNIKTSFGAVCAVAELDDVGVVLQGSIDNLSASASAFGEISGSIGG